MATLLRAGACCAGFPTLPCAIDACPPHRLADAANTLGHNKSILPQQAPELVGQRPACAVC